MARTIAQYARAYVEEFGMSIVPLNPRTKKSTKLGWEKKENQITDPDEAEAFYRENPNANIGVGLHNSGLCSLDIDNEPYARMVFEEWGIDLDALIANNPTVRGRGYRIEFKAPEGVPLGQHTVRWPYEDLRTDKDGRLKYQTIFEMRSGDCQDVLPPSIHPDTNQPYTWPTSPSIVTFKEPPEEVLALWRNWQIFLEQAKEVCPWAPKVELPAPTKPPRPREPGQVSVIEEYNRAYGLTNSLEHYGYKRRGKRYLSPHSSTGLAGVKMFEDNRCWIHHGSDPLCSTDTGQPVGPFDLFCYYEHGSDASAAVREAVDLLGLTARPTEVIEQAILEEPEEEPTRWVQPAPKAGTVSPEIQMAPDAWPDPVDIFRKSSLPPVLTSYVPPELVDYIWDQSDLMGSEPDILVLCCLVAASTCLHDGIKIQPKVWDDGWTESGRLWGAFVGDPSIKKSPTMGKAVNHLQEIDINLSHESDAGLGRYEEEMDAYKRAVKASAKTGHSAGEKPKPPPKRRLIIEDFTSEAMGDLLKDNERGMFAQFDELGLFFGQMDAYRQSGQSKDRSLWLRAYNGGAYRVDRKGAGSVFVPNWSMRVLGGIQPSAIQSIAAKLPEDGLLQRFMIVMAQSSDRDDDDRVPNYKAKAGYRQLLKDIFAMQPSEEPAKFSEEAQAVRKAFEAERKQLIGLANLPRALTVALGKWDGLFCRLALVHHAIYCACTKQHPVNVPVSADIAKRVGAYLMEYMLFHGVAFYGDVLGGSDRAEHAKWIAGWIAAKPEMTSVGSRDLARSYSKWASLPEWAQRDTMRILEDYAWLTPSKMTGKRTTQWHVNPKASSTFADIGNQMAAERLKRREALLRASEARRGDDQ